MDGGHEGSANYIEVIRKHGGRERYAFVSGLVTHTDDVIRVVTGNGGGIGNPEDRDRAAVAEDVLNGLITKDRAADIYGWRP